MQNLIEWVWIALGLVTLPALLFVVAPYGRHARAGWGPGVPAALAWLLMEAPSPLLMAAWFIAGGRWRDPTAWVFLLLWEAHYVHRAFIFPFRKRGVQAPMPLGVALMAVFFNLVNGTLNGRWLFVLSDPYGAGWLVGARFLAGAALFLAGWAINLHSDAVLLRLRGPGESGYRIPRGGLYRWISCPNYFGEMIEWWGWALATWSLAGVSFAVWTMANLLPRALSHHRWYRETFADYPPERRAVVPFLL